MKMSEEQKGIEREGREREKKSHGNRADDTERAKKK
jgi:hypothetical protein